MAETQEEPKQSEEQAEQPKHEDRFVEWLVGLEGRRDRGALAALRRGLGKPMGAAPEMFPLLVPWTGNLPPWKARWYYTVASLFAVHPSNTAAQHHNFGTTMRQVRHQRKTTAPPTGESADRFDAVERRFIALLRSHPDELADHLRHAVSLAKSADVPVNWAQLLRDLQAWEVPERYVQTRWAEAFWALSPAEEAETGDTEQSSGH